MMSKKSDRVKFTFANAQPGALDNMADVEKEGETIILSLAEAYPKEQERCRELLEGYKQINTGGFGVLVIGDILERAEIAAANQDTAEMIKVFQEMRDCQ